MSAIVTMIYEGAVSISLVPPAPLGPQIGIQTPRRFTDLALQPNSATQQQMAVSVKKLAAGVILRDVRPWNLKRHDRRFLRTKQSNRSNVPPNRRGVDSVAWREALYGGKR
jgi:hypothetical protein